MTQARTTLLAALRRVTPAPLRRLGRGLFPVAATTANAVDASGQAAPPKAMWALVGDPNDDFGQVSEEFKRLFVACGLKPDHAFLDVGCGIGRAAAPLIGYLDANGLYRGFDVMAEAVAWCDAHIAARDPRFQFLRADLRSDRYNPGGATPASAYVFPYPDAMFDFVWLGSVFTHLLAADQAQFAREIARVLKPGGTSVISWYLLDEAARTRAGTGVSAFEFAHALDGCWTATPDLPEAVIAYDLDAMLAQYEALGFEVVERKLGVWREQAIQDQDILVARKRA